MPIQRIVREVELAHEGHYHVARGIDPGHVVRVEELADGDAARHQEAGEVQVRGQELNL